MFSSARRILAIILFEAFALAAQADSPGEGFLFGINFPQASFAPERTPGQEGRDFFWPAGEDIDAYAAMGFNAFRVAILWERLQPDLLGPLDGEAINRLDALAGRAAAAKAILIIDIHNYGKFNGAPVGSAQVSVEAFAKLWSMLATHFRDNANVAFGLMNEPYLQGASEWRNIAQQAIRAIRATGARQMILVSGTHYSGAHSWLNGDKDSNGDAMAGLVDPADNFLFEPHQYFDADSSGTTPSCEGPNIGATRLDAMTKWLRGRGAKALLGEFGAAASPTCLSALKTTLEYMERNQDVWRGWAYWAAAPQFGDYMFNIYPPEPRSRPQLDVLRSGIVPPR
ncbi:glycoside hydrolase family 5 protein [Rhodoblastus acidophilus]|uniref:glycoside hydrolase family 5 protein n=1 Tax=Rhodoblastus acidophilus TaxID=1074 RepID=UPI0022243B3C|nr:glycoside hydrolase family 5 protein [Rhodoblastus acidophilus]